MWILVLFLVSLNGLLLGTRVFRGYDDVGYATSKSLVLLIFGYVVWLAGFTVSIPSPTILLGLFLLLTCVNALLHHKNVQNLSASSVKSIAAEEFIFVVLFLTMCWFRSVNPRIEGIEKFMDFAIINGLNRSAKLPPVDVWFSGYPVNYYYFGHFLMMILNKLTFTPLTIGYNLLIAYIFATSGSSAFSIVLNITKKYRYGLLSIILLIGAGNLDFLVNYYFNHQTNYFYAAARSLIPFTINEFPLYSFLISDLHAHILNIPFVLLFLSFALYALQKKTISLKDNFYEFFALSFGALGAINTWDMIFYGIVLAAVFGCVYVQKPESTLIIKAFARLAVFVAIATIFFLPFYLNFHPPVGGIEFFIPKFVLAANLKMFGLFLAVVLPYLFLIRWTRKDENSFIATLLSLTGILLVLLPSFFLVKDIYFKLNPPYASANTYFKVWYQAWIIFALATPVCISILLKRAKYAGYLIVTVFLVLSASCLHYTYNAVKYIVGPHYINNGLDGSSYLLTELPSEKATIDWINQNVQKQPVLLELYGESYTKDSVVASYTGLPTLVGWSNHELGWRDDWPSIANRMGDIEHLYQLNDLDQVRNLVRKYNIQYILVSDRERAKLGYTAGQLLASISTKVYQSGTVELYRVNPF